MSAPNESSTSKDPEEGASERLVLDQQAAHHSKDQRVEMKYVSGPKNGEPKINNFRIAFVGMGKEELMKYANDPFWVKMRWSLFITFWVLWFAMLAGAIAIIILAPKCSIYGKTTLPQDPVIYEIELDKSDSSESSLAVLNSSILSMTDSGVDLVVISSLMKSSEDGRSVVNFTEIDPSYGSPEDIQTWLKSIKNAGIKIVMSFVPNYSSDEHPWFQHSVNSHEPYSDFYVWNKGPINNWKSVDDTQSESAWTLNDVRKEYYLHQFKKNQPDLNFRNPDVVGNLSDALRFWMDLGFYGLHLDKAEFLVEDKDFKDEPIINNPSSLSPSSDYRMLNHLYTTHLPETMNIVNDWSDIVVNDKKGFLSTSHLKDTSKPSLIRSPVIDIGYNKDLSKKLLVEELHKIISNRLSHPEVTWEWNLVCSDTPAVDCSKATTALKVFSVLLPGSPIIKESPDVDLNDTKNLFPTKYKEFLLQRKSLGTQKVKFNHINDTIISYTRTKDADSGYITLLNLGQSATVSSLSIADSANNYTVAAVSESNDNLPTGHVLSPPIEIPPLTTLIISYHKKSSS